MAASSHVIAPDSRCSTAAPPILPTVAPPTSRSVPSTLDVLSPLHAVQLLHLIVSLSFTCHALAVLSYLVSPSHVVVLVLRVVLLVQFGNPRRTHPTRSLRFFVALWAVQALGITALHAVTGSTGTKGPRGHAQGGLVLDFVGQAATPSLLHLLVIDVLLAFFQLATLLVAFGATVPNDLDASTGGGGEGARDYSALLGVVGHHDEEDAREEDAAGRSPRRRARARKRRGYESVPLGVEEEEEDDDERSDLDALDAEADALGLGFFKPPSASSSRASASAATDPSAQYVRLPLIADVRLQAAWTEVRKSARQVGAEREEAGVRGLEEGRGGGGGTGV
ncbi:hypothetical protein DMC30DRAFT_416500 [Rhodotorula diobovata]|uniref:DUF1746 domain-containing protein n=1 Tax=Rhodotorula diobovata TaxID=5288 RepID=A0A5C5FVN8_9BASI|nr:hypothetical protein DMC30DRAFT_416500 [Rhodotorula diobovata]